MLIYYNYYLYYSFIIVKKYKFFTTFFSEIQRRLALSKYSVWFEVIFNGHTVCESTSLPIDDSFSVDVSQKFVVEIHQWPDTLSLNIHSENLSSKTIFTKTPIAELYIPFPIRYHC